MGNKKVNFIIIDDSELDCFIAEKLVKHTGVSGSVKSFLQAADALKYIKENTDTTPTVLLLDILMPIMSGIDFVEEFEQLPDQIQQRYYIVAFTSSMNKKDMGTMKSYECVRSLFDKPLSPEVLESVLEDCKYLP